MMMIGDLGLLLILFSFITSAEVSPQQKLRQRKGVHYTPTSPSTSSRERKPNIVLILTDDQDVELGSLNFMPKTLRAIRDQGAQFRHAYVTTPMCCPSRSSLLTGMYVHNHQVYTNNDNCSSTQWQATYETRSFATYLSNAGYRTGYFGKYLNKYNGSYIPPGWREWGGLIMNSKYYNYSINMNGKKIKHGFDYHKDYYSDLIANDSIAFLRQSKKNNAHKPVMLTMSFPAPHGPEDSAPQYSHLFFNVTTHHTPSYDYAPNPDKQWILQITKKMQPIHKQFTDLLMTKRLQTLQSVDHAVQRIIEELDRLGELENTYIIYTSDHGYHLGQFGLIKGKSFPFEFDVRIPFLVRGPGVEPGTVVNDIVLNIDLAPTFLDIAGVEVPPHMDGRSVLPLFLNSKRKRMRWPDTFLIESSGRRETPFLDAKLKANKLLSLIQKNTTTENDTSNNNNSTKQVIQSTTPGNRIYDSVEDLIDDNDDVDDDIILDDDDDENVEENEPADAAMHLQKKNIRDDQLTLSDETILPANKLERLNTECLQNEMQLPCQTNQKWYCINENGRWRKHKCKTLEQIPYPNNINKSFRKCACFTSIGLVYRRIPLKNITKRQTRISRIKKDADLNTILFQKLVNNRRKRNTLAHVENVMKDVQGKINGLQSVNSSLILDETIPKGDLETNTISETTAGCVIFDKGRVNCSKSIYHDRKTWRQSRHQIDNEIHQLKQKLDKLKEIRRHLKHSKPLDGEIDFNNNTTSNETERFPNEYNELTLPLEPELDKRKRKRPFSTRRPRYRLEIDDDRNRNNIANPHRHNHNVFSTTTNYFDIEFTTESTTTTTATTTTKATRRRQDTIPYPKNKLDNNYCHCEADEVDEPDEKELAKEAKRKLKEEKLKKKLRKQRKKDQLERECASERMNCFHHDNEHWKTAPLWTEGPFCFCMNANNNTYSCIRTINSTHNFLYCEFTTGLVTFYNLRIDPFELQNRIDVLKPEEKGFLHDQLKDLVACKGRNCTVNNNPHAITRNRANILPMYHSNAQYRLKKRKFLDSYDFGHVNGRHIRRFKNGTLVGNFKEAIVRRRRKS